MSDHVSTTRDPDAHERTEPRKGKVLTLTFPAWEWEMLTEFVYGHGKTVSLVEFKAMMRERIEKCG